MIQTARVVLALMAADIRSACPLPKGAAFLGVGRTLGDIQADNLDFATHHFSPVHDGDGEFCESSYFVQRNPKTGRFSLWRRRNPIFALDPLSGGMQEELATGVRGLAFQYYDGLDWYDNWGDADGKGRTGGAGKKQNSLKVRSNLEGLPAAVKITLSLDSNPKKSRPDEVPSAIQSLEPPMVFQTVARIEVASDSSSGASLVSRMAEPGLTAQDAGVVSENHP